MDTPSASDDDLGTTINGRYELVSLLGAGGMGKVYRANDTSTGKPVALKRLQKQEEHLRTMFQQEYQTLESLAHPGIIQVFDYGVDEAGPYYTMELLAGEDMVANKAVSWQEICGLLREVAGRAQGVEVDHLLDAARERARGGRVEGQRPPTARGPPT